MGQSTYSKDTTHLSSAVNAAENASEKTSGEPIVFYSKTGCLWCNAVRHLLSEHDVAFEEREVIKEPRFMEELTRETKQDSTPTLKIGGEWLVDTDAKAVAKRLGLPEPHEVERAAAA